MGQIVTRDKLAPVLSHSKKCYLKIEVLNKEKVIINTIQGLCLGGNITIDSSSDIRRTCSLSMYVESADMYPTPDGIMFLNKYIKIYSGTKLPNQEEIQWVNMGIFTYSDIGYSYSSNDKTLSLSGMDLMAELTGYRKGNIDAQSLELQAKKGTDITTTIVDTLKQFTDFTDFNVDTIGSEYAAKHSNYTGAAYTDLPYNVSITSSPTVYAILNELISLYPNWEMYFDTEGVFNLHMIPDGQNEPNILTDDVLRKITMNDSINVNPQTVFNRCTVFGAEIESDDAIGINNLFELGHNNGLNEITGDPKRFIDSSYYSTDGYTDSKGNVKVYSVYNENNTDEGIRNWMIEDGEYVEKNPIVRDQQVLSLQTPKSFSLEHDYKYVMLQTGEEYFISNKLINDINVLGNGQLYTYRVPHVRIDGYGEVALEQGYKVNVSSSDFSCRIVEYRNLENDNWYYDDDFQNDYPNLGMTLDEYLKKVFVIVEQDIIIPRCYTSYDYTLKDGQPVFNIGDDESVYITKDYDLNYIGIFDKARSFEYTYLFSDGLLFNGYIWHSGQNVYFENIEKDGYHYDIFEGIELQKYNSFKLNNAIKTPLIKNGQIDSYWDIELIEGTIVESCEDGSDEIVSGFIEDDYVVVKDLNNNQKGFDGVYILIKEEYLTLMNSIKTNLYIANNVVLDDNTIKSWLEIEECSPMITFYGDMDNKSDLNTRRFVPIFVDNPVIDYDYDPYSQEPDFPTPKLTPGKIYNFKYVDASNYKKWTNNQLIYFLQMFAGTYRNMILDYSLKRQQDVLGISGDLKDEYNLMVNITNSIIMLEKRSYLTEAMFKRAMEVPMMLGCSSSTGQSGGFDKEVEIGYFLLLGETQIQATLEVTDESNPFNIYNIGTVPVVYSGDEYENITSNELALQRARWELYKSTRFQYSLDLQTPMMPWLDVNNKIQYTPYCIEESKEWLIKSVSHDLSSWTTNISAIEYFPYYDPDTQISYDIINTSMIPVFDKDKINGLYVVDSKGNFINAVVGDSAYIDEDEEGNMFTRWYIDDDNYYQVPVSEDELIQNADLLGDTVSIYCDVKPGYNFIGWVNQSGNILSDHIIIPIVQDEDDNYIITDKNGNKRIIRELHPIVAKSDEFDMYEYTLYGDEKFDLINYGRHLIPTSETYSKTTGWNNNKYNICKYVLQMNGLAFVRYNDSDDKLYQTPNFEKDVLSGDLVESEGFWNNDSDYLYINRYGWEQYRPLTDWGVQNLEHDQWSETEAEAWIQWWKDDLDIMVTGRPLKPEDIYLDFTPIDSYGIVIRSKFSERCIGIIYGSIILESPSSSVFEIIRRFIESSIIAVMKNHNITMTDDVEYRKQCFEWLVDYMDQLRRNGQIILYLDNDSVYYPDGNTNFYYPEKITGEHQNYIATANKPIIPDIVEYTLIRYEMDEESGFVNPTSPEIITLSENGEEWTVLKKEDVENTIAHISSNNLGNQLELIVNKTTSDTEYRYNGIITNDISANIFTQDQPRKINFLGAFEMNPHTLNVFGNNPIYCDGEEVEKSFIDKLKMAIPFRYSMSKDFSITDIPNDKTRSVMLLFDYHNYLRPFRITSEITNYPTYGETQIVENANDRWLEDVSDYTGFNNNGKLLGYKDMPANYPGTSITKFMPYGTPTWTNDAGEVLTHDPVLTYRLFEDREMIIDENYNCYEEDKKYNVLHLTSIWNRQWSHMHMIFTPKSEAMMSYNCDVLYSNSWDKSDIIGGSWPSYKFGDIGLTVSVNYTTIDYTAINVPYDEIYYVKDIVVKWEQSGVTQTKSIAKYVNYGLDIGLAQTISPPNGSQVNIGFTQTTKFNFNIDDILHSVITEKNLQSNMEIIFECVDGVISANDPIYTKLHERAFGFKD